MVQRLSDGRLLILASGSVFRKALLQRLGLPFIVQVSDIDETPRDHESGADLVRRLAIAKARAVAAQHRDAVVIGSDQVAMFNGQSVSKPAGHAQAVAQLRQASGQTVRFYTGLCVYDMRSQHQQADVVPFDVVFRSLSDRQIEAYLRREQPYDCAGSFKSEGLGIVLFERLQGDDPNSLIGLPLIRLYQMLEAAQVQIL